MDVSLVICILCTDFANTTIWESWRADTDTQVETRIGFVTHPRPVYKDHIAYAIDEPIETKWGDDSLVWAEIKMLDEARIRFPNAIQFLIVSGDSVPIRSKEDFLSFFVDDVETTTNLSMMTMFTHVQPRRSSRNLLYGLHMRRLYNGHQFMGLHRKHVDFLLSSEGLDRLAALAAVEYQAPRFTGNFSPDEVYIQTLLANIFPTQEFYNHRFVEFIRDDIHAKTIESIQEFSDLYEECMQSGTLFCIRKVQKSLQWDVYRFLESKAVLGGE